MSNQPDNAKTDRRRVVALVGDVEAARDAHDGELLGGPALEVLVSGAAELATEAQDGRLRDLGEVGKGVADAIGGAAGAIGGFFSGLGKQKEATPPPVPIVKYYAVQDGEQAGPFTLDEIGALAADGKLDAETLVWKDGMSGWEPAGGVSELADVLGFKGESAPPPLG